VTDTTGDGAEVVAELGPDHVATVEIRRPPNNFFDAVLIAELADVLEDLAGGTDARAVVLCSAGRHFCAGANFGGGRRENDAGDLYAAAVRVFRQPLPIVAAVQGFPPLGAWETSRQTDSCLCGLAVMTCVL